MKHNIFIKSALRQPLKTVLLLLLSGMVSFVLMSRVVEHVIIKRESDRISDYYRPIGTLFKYGLSDESTDEDYDISQGAAIVGGSKYVAFEDRRRALSATLGGMYNSDTDGYSSITPSLLAKMAEFYPSEFVAEHYNYQIYVSDVFYYGTLVSKADVKRSETTHYYVLQFDIDDWVAGYPEYQTFGMTKGEVYSIRLIPEMYDSGIVQQLDDMVVGGRYFVRAYYNQFPEVGEHSGHMTIRPLIDGSILCLPVGQGESVDFSTPGMEVLRDMIETQTANQHAMMAVATKDLSAMPAMQESMRTNYLTEGRWIDINDDRRGNSVCVVHSDFAKARGLAVGDNLSLTFRDISMPNYYGYFYVDEDVEGWRKFPTYEAEFEIVGLYSRIADGFVMTNESNFMYIPDSCKPLGFGKISPLKEYFYSFTLKSAEDKSAFSEEYSDALAEAGVGVRFIDNDYESFREAAMPLRQSTVYNAVIFGIAAIVVMSLLATLYVRQYGKEYAIARSLGMTKQAAQRHLLVPIMVVGALGVFAGGAASWDYTLVKAAETLNYVEAATNHAVSAELSVAWLAGLCLAILSLLFIPAWVWVCVVGRRSIIEQMQGGAVTTGAGKETRANREAAGAKLQEKQGASAPPYGLPAKRKNENTLTGSAPSLLTPGGSQQPALANEPSGENAPQHKPRHYGRKQHGLRMFFGRFSAAAFVRFTYRLLSRSALKNAFVAVIALMFVIAPTWMQQKVASVGKEIDVLYDTTVVQIGIEQRIRAMVSTQSGGAVIHRRTVDAIMNSGLAADAYLETGCEMQYIAAPDPEGATPLANNGDGTVNSAIPASGKRKDKPVLCAFNDTQRFFSGTAGSVNVTYAEGWDENLFSMDWTRAREKSEPIPIVVSAATLSELDLKNGGIAYITDYSGDVHNCLVVGVYGGLVGFKGDSAPVLLPYAVLKAQRRSLREELEGISSGGIPFRYATAEFTIDPSYNRELSEWTETVREIVEAPDAGRLPLRLVVWDEALRVAVGPMEKNLQLLKVLYPTTVALSVLIAVFLPVLMTLQRKKEAAIMRALGTGKRRTRAVLCVEQAVICLAGLLLGLGACALFLWGNKTVTRQSLICAGLYLAGSLLGSIVSAYSITRRSPLALLQVRE